jgi:chemotaxis signal transduction protein
MTVAAPGLAVRAAALRAEFDHAFALPSRTASAANADLIAIRAGAEPCALRLAEITGLFADRKITRLPGGHSALLGIAGFRGALVPVYALTALLGMSVAPTSRWLVLAAAAPVALAFDAFEGHLRASSDAILTRQSQAEMRGFAPEFIRTTGIVRPVINLAAVVAALGTAEAAQINPMQE